MERIKFGLGKQKEFLKEVLITLDCPTLKELSDRFDLNYSTMKNYFSEKRLLPEEVFSDLCFVSKLNKERFSFQILKGNFGQIFGGKKSRKSLNKRKI